MDMQTWNNLVASALPPFGGFLQSYSWGEFQQALGFSVERVFKEEAGKTIIAQAIKNPLPLRSSYWFVPKGPLGTASLATKIEVLSDALPGGAFLKIEPTEDAYGNIRAKDRQPAVTTLVDLRQEYEQILAKMKTKTRYNIRLAEKKGVTAEIVGIERFDDLARLMEQTAERDKFHLHDMERYRTMLKMLNGPDCKAFLVLACAEERPLAANIMIDSFGTRTYLHGASSNLYRNLMAPYAIHDFLIKDAKEKGLHTYDFWGIAPPLAGDEHPWAGISRFKNGFGGQVVEMPGTYDVPQNNLVYQTYKLARKVRGLE